MKCFTNSGIAAVAARTDLVLVVLSGDRSETILRLDGSVEPERTNVIERGLLWLRDVRAP